jgi:hypothetical protein
VALQTLEQRTGGRTFLETLESTGDEDNPFKTVRKLFTDLRRVRETQSSISAELQMVLKEDIPSAFQRLCENRQLTVTILSTSVMVLGLCVLGVWAGIESANILTDSVAISDYESDGQWYFGFRAGETNIPSVKEAAAASYKNACYKTIAPGLPPINKVTCDQVYHTSIPYTSALNAPCPFAGDVCLQGSTAAFTLSTGWTDTNTLGINAPYSSRMRFQKAMTCSPVSSDEPWVSYDENGRNWEYFYHRMDKSPYINLTFTNLTFTNPGDWSRFVGSSVGYSAKYEYHPQNECSQLT